MTGDSIKVVERAGTPVERILVTKDPWEKERCKRKECRVCSDSDRGICRTKNVVYQHLFCICKEKGISSVYWGQTSRTLAERSPEHDSDFANLADNSHVFQHLKTDHPEVLEKIDVGDLWKTFSWKIFRKTRTAFSRKLLEAIMIKMSKSSRKENNLNLKEEWAGYDLPSLNIKGVDDEEEQLEPRLGVEKDHGSLPEREGFALPNTTYVYQNLDC